MKMPTWEDQLPPLMKERLAAVSEAGPDERDLLKQREEVQSHLAEFYKHELDPDELCRKLESGTAAVIIEAQLNLVESLSLGLRPAWFRTTKAAILQMERLKKNQRVRLLERQLNKIGELLTSYRETMERALQEVVEKEIWSREPTIGPGRWISIHGALSVDTDMTERLAEAQLQAERLYGEEFATAVKGLRQLADEEV
jgi:hypothetical protein